MKILLVYPEYTKIYGNYKPAAEVASLYPPLGLMCLASSLKKDNHRVKIVDCEIEQMSINDFIRTLEKMKPDVVGITSTTPLHHKAIELFNIIKKHFPDWTTLSGGPHVSSLPIESMEECPAIDIACIGEGEETIREICKNLDQLSEVIGIIERDKEKINKTQPMSMIKNLDSLSFPSR